MISLPIDFLGLNYYSPATIAAVSRAAEARTAGYTSRPENPTHLGRPRHDARRPPGLRTYRDGLGNRVGALTELLVNLNRDYQLPPILITENGAACADYVDPAGAVRDDDRISYLHDHLRAVLTARRGRR